MKNCSIFFLLIILLAATLVQCHYEHWYQHFNKDSTTSTTTAKILAADAKAEASGGNVKNSHTFADDFEERSNRAKKITIGIVIGVLIFMLIFIGTAIYCFIRFCKRITEHNPAFTQSASTTVTTNPIGQARVEYTATQVYVQPAVPNQTGAYQTQPNAVSGGLMQHPPPPSQPLQHQQGHAQEVNRSNHDIYAQSNFSPHDQPQQPPTAPPPYREY